MSILSETGSNADGSAPGLENGCPFKMTVEAKAGKNIYAVFVQQTGNSSGYGSDDVYVYDFTNKVWVLDTAITNYADHCTTLTESSSLAGTYNKTIENFKSYFYLEDRGGQVVIEYWQGNTYSRSTDKRIGVQRGYYDTASCTWIEGDPSITDIWNSTHNVQNSDNSNQTIAESQQSSAQCCKRLTALVRAIHNKVYRKDPQ